MPASPTPSPPSPSRCPPASFCGGPSTPLPYTNGELTPRTFLTLFILGLFIAISYFFAHISVFPIYPLLHPIAHILLILACWSSFATVRRSNSRRSRLLVNARYASSTPSCGKCSQPKPTRTHHCSRCRECTQRMSHHCGVLGMCVGAHNHKAFVLLLFYGFVSTALLAVLCLPEALRRGRAVLMGESRITVRVIGWFQMYYLQYCMSMMMGGMLVFHLYLIAMNRTVLEACKLHPRGEVFPPWKAAKFPFDRGARENFGELFGSPWTALLPIADYGWVAWLDGNGVSPA